MANEYQLMEGQKGPAYEIETIDGTDPQLGLTRMPGPVMGIPTMTEDFQHEMITPVGAGPQVHNIIQKAELFALEFNIQLSEKFDDVGDNEFFSLAIGTVDGPSGGNTGAVTHTPKRRSYMAEHGFISPDIQTGTVQLVTAIDAVVYTITIDGFPFSETASSDTVDSLRDDLVGLIGKYKRLTHSTIALPADRFTVGETIDNQPTPTATAEVLFSRAGEVYIREITGTFADSDPITGLTSGKTATASASGALNTIVTATSITTGGNDSLLLTAAVTGKAFSLAVSSSQADPDDDDIKITGETNTSWLHLNEGCKTQDFSKAWRAQDLTSASFTVWPRKSKGLTRPQFRFGTMLDEIIVPVEPSVQAQSTVFILKKQNGDVIDHSITEFDLAYTNDLERRFSDNGQLFAKCLIEGQRAWTFTVKMDKGSDNNALQDISRAQPSDLTNGRLDVEWLTNQTSGFFFDLNLDSVVLSDMTREQGSEVRHIEESFAGVQVGVPTLDLRV